MSNTCKEDEIFEVAFSVNNLDMFEKFYKDNQMDYDINSHDDEYGTIRSLVVKPPFPFLKFRLVDRSE